MDSYQKFLFSRRQGGENHGFPPVWEPEFLFDFQASLVDWAVRKGKAAIFADCGLGKTPMQLVWAENVLRKTNKPVLVLTPLAVSDQTVEEGKKFGIECFHSREGKFPKRALVVVTNYERLHYFSPDDFSGVVCDESAVLKNFDGVRKAAITEFMRTRSYRLLCTATAAPNDHIEFGTASEALGEMGYMDMLGRFFKNDQNSLHPFSGRGRFGLTERSVVNKWRFRGHSETDFWRWICSWARALRKPSDIQFEDGPFTLPPLKTYEHIVCAARNRKLGTILTLPAETLSEQREERRHTLKERCETAASLVEKTGKSAVMWCYLNSEGDLLERLVPESIQISGSDSDERKEEVFRAFVQGKIRVLITKPIIAGYGLNWQHCSHQTFFPSHSFEQWYQAVRRSWRFGQKNPVRVDVITSEGEMGVLKNLNRKAKQADYVFSRLVELMGEQLKISTNQDFPLKEELPKWL